METEKVHLTKEKETLLATLYGRAADSRERDPILGDPFAEDVVRRIDYDFRKLRLRKNDPMSIAIRAKYLDLWAKEFLGEHPDAIVLHLGCGLDSRALRLAPPASVRWYDVDYPEVIELRRRLYPPPRAGYQTIASSVTDPRWLDEVPTDGPVLVVAEGLMPYLTESTGVELLARLTRRFDRGEIVFDAWNRLAVRLYKLQPTVRATGATIGWGIDDPRELERGNARLELVTEQSLLDVPEIARFSRPEQWIARAFMAVPALRRLGRLLRYRFPRAAS